MAFKLAITESADGRDDIKGQKLTGYSGFLNEKRKLIISLKSYKQCFWFGETVDG